MTSFSIPPSISQTLETFTLFCPTKFAKITTLGCALPALEMAIRIIVDAKGICCTSKEPSYRLFEPESANGGSTQNMLSVREQENKRHWSNFSKNLSGAIFFGLCLTNAYTRVIGTVIFTGYSLCYYSRKEGLKESYAVSKCIASPVHRFWDSILIPLCEQVILPIIKKLGRILSTVLSWVSLPVNPAWYGVIILATGLAAAKGVQVLRARQ